MSRRNRAASGVCNPRPHGRQKKRKKPPRNQEAINKAKHSRWLAKRIAERIGK